MSNEPVEFHINADKEPDEETVALLGKMAKQVHASMSSELAERLRRRADQIKAYSGSPTWKPMLEAAAELDRLTAAVHELEEMVSDGDSARNRLTAVLSETKRDLEKVVCTKEPDDGVILLSGEGPTHFDPDTQCQVYDHDHFSPLGDALIAIHKNVSDLVIAKEM